MTALPRQRYGRMWACRLAAAVVGVAGLLVATGATAAGKPATHTVIIEGTQYAPAMLSVKRGDTIVWINKDPFPHTVTAKGVFDSGDIAANRSWQYTARKRGEFAYLCTLHQTMKGTLKVE